MFFDYNFDDLLDSRVAEIRDMSPEQAASVEFGATTIIGILSETAAEVTEGASEEANALVEALFDKANERVENVRVATVETQIGQSDDCEDDEEEAQTYTDGSEPAEEDDEAALTSAIDDLVEGLFAAFIGKEAAADMRKRVEAGRAEAEVEEEESEEDALARETEEFLASLFRAV